MKIAVIGTRGFPNIQGGVEKHCEILYGLISKKNYKIHVFRRKPFINQSSVLNPPNIIFYDLWTPKNKYFETILHSFFAALKSISLKPDLVHIHNIGPALVLPLFKLFKIPTVVTYHSDNYNHDKWNIFAKKILKIGERFVDKFAYEVIVVSERQKSLFKDANINHIPNGINLPQKDSSKEYLKKFGIVPQKYILAVTRFSQEKGLHLLLDAFAQIEYARGRGYKLVIAGDADHDSEYSRTLKKRINENPRIVGTGYITGKMLNQVYSHAGLFVLPSYHEGLPISLLEAMSYGLPVLVSDIPANREVELSEERFFKCGDAKDLQQKLEKLLNKTLSFDEKEKIKQQIAGKYNWEKIAIETIAVYEKVAKRLL